MTPNADYGMVRWEPVDDDEARANIGLGVHTGLRKGTEAPSSAAIWRAISDSDDDAWQEALTFAIDGLRAMGLRLCREVEISPNDGSGI